MDTLWGGSSYPCPGAIAATSATCGAYCLVRTRSFARCSCAKLRNALYLFPLGGAGVVLCVFGPSPYSSRAVELHSPLRDARSRRSQEEAEWQAGPIQYGSPRAGGARPKAFPTSITTT